MPKACHPALFLLWLMGLIHAPASATTWTASHFRGRPEPAHRFISEPIFTHLTLKNVTDLVFVPGHNQWLIAENTGKIWSAPADPPPHANPPSAATLALDLKALHPACDHVYGIAFHPKFAENRQVFITYTVGNKLPAGSRLSRFMVAQEDPLIISPHSEQILLTWLSGGHNGAALAFGPDGYLYLSTGDAEVPNPPDPLNTGQVLSDLLSSILRIDVNKPSANLPYSIPSDNPFLNTPNARPEIWAYGLRNPWKISFDSQTGRLWCGDVGWQEWESIHLITRGGNYGWPATEGSNVIDSNRYRGPSPLSPAVVTHCHAEAASITGGFVYHGSAFPELKGAYLYADYETGKIWALWHDGQSVTRHEEIADTPYAIVSFGQAADGELLFAHYAGTSTLHRLRRNPEAGSPSNFPHLLSATGLFIDVTKQTPAAGVSSFNIRSPLWADGASATRFVGMVKGHGGIQTTLSTDPKTKRPRAKMSWPKDAVLAKTLAIETTQGDPTTQRKIETQVLHYDGESWQAYSYRWNEAETDAELVDSAGAERKLDLKSAAFPAGHHRYTYRFHSRAECLRCHNNWGGYALSFHPMQLAEPDSLLQAGYFDPNFLLGSDVRLVDPEDDSQELPARARAWLHTQCASCHREHGGGSVPLMLNAELATADLRAINESPTRGDFALPNARVIAPGDPASSILLHRIAKSGTGKMPMIGSQLVEKKALRLLADWIRSLASPSPPASITDSNDPRHTLTLALQVDQGLADPNLAITMAQTTPHPHVRDLLERFLPDAERVPTLGPQPSAASILALQGSTQRGAKLFTSQGKAAACTACHFINGIGNDFGPDLSQLGTRLPPETILESLLTPSKTITKGFQTAVVTLKNQQIHSGFVTDRDENAMTLKIGPSQALTLPNSSIQSEQTLPTSLMPEGLMQGFTAQEAADLVAYLSSLKAAATAPKP